jgi:hypothetical protein
MGLVKNGLIFRAQGESETHGIELFFDFLKD